VFVWGWKLGVPLGQLIAHDFSKLFNRTETRGYVAMSNFWAAKRAQESKTTPGPAAIPPQVKAAYDAGWINHQNMNRHHWEFWMNRNDNGKVTPIPMPMNYARELVADWIAANKVYAASKEFLGVKWFTDNVPKMTLHPETRRNLHNILANEVPKRTGKVVSCEITKLFETD
jgi:hypothetical protein